jgi:LCP family protein required for cell wall assembly
MERGATERRSVDGSLRPMPTDPAGDADALHDSPAATRRRRTWPQRLLIAFNVFVVMVALTGALALSRYHTDVTELDRISAAGALAQTAPDDPMEPRNILVVGVDNAEGLDEDDPVLVGRNETSLLSDTIMIVRVDPAQDKAWLLSLPRDLYVPIADSRRKDRINAALALGGPDRLIDTIQQDFDIPIHHYVQVNFQGFKDLTSIVGGVPLSFEHPGRDQRTGFDSGGAGCVVLEGDQALAFVRSRYYESQIDGRWVQDPSSDLGRIRRQQVFIRAALDRALAQGARNPLELRRMLEAAQGEVILDDTLSLGEALDLGDRLRDFDPEELVLMTVPATGGKAGEASVLFVDEREAQSIFDIFRGAADDTDPNAIVRIDVRNGTGEANQGSEVAAELDAAGFTVVGSSDAGTFGRQRTTLKIAPGQFLAAVHLARYLEVEVEFADAEPGEAGDAGVILVTGDDWAGVLDEPKPLEEVVSAPGEVPDDPGAALVEGEASSASTTPTTQPSVHVPQVPPGATCG